MSGPAVIVLYGPTAVGKTALLEEAAGGKFEVVNADSRQVYRFLDIGTAKPDRSIRQAIPHHLIDICTPDEQYAAGRFVRDTELLIAEIHVRGAIPIVAGGTGYYLKNLLYGLPDTPGAFPEIREHLQSEMERRGSESLHQELQSVDPQSAERISVHDRYRIQRALEVFRGTGRPRSSFSVPDVLRTDHPWIVLSLERDRSELYRRINARVEQMFEDGLLCEIARALSSGYDEKSPGLRSIGYREVLEVRRTGCGSVRTLIELIQRNTRRFAKRQITFFRGFDPDYTLHPGDVERFREILDGVRLQ